MNNMKSLSNKNIANIYYFNYEGDMGFYESYRNFCLNNMVSLNFAIPGKKISHVNATPSINKISSESTKEIQDFVAEKLKYLKQIQKPKNYETPEYFMIVYTDGICEYYEFDNEFFQIFKMGKFIDGESDVLLTPYLVYESLEYAKKIRVLDCIKTLIEEKKIRKILDYVSSDCILEENYGNYCCVKTKKKIDKVIKKKVGFMGIKVSKIHLFTLLEGSLNENGESIVEIKIEVSTNHGHGKTYLLSPEFNGANEITHLKFYIFDESKKNTKTLYDDKLEKAKQAIYNDYKTV